MLFISNQDFIVFSEQLIELMDRYRLLLMVVANLRILVMILLPIVVVHKIIDH